MTFIHCEDHVIQPTRSIRWFYIEWLISEGVSDVHLWPQMFHTTQDTRQKSHYGRDVIVLKSFQIHLWANYPPSTDDPAIVFSCVSLICSLLWSSSRLDSLMFVCKYALYSCFTGSCRNTNNIEFLSETSAPCHNDLGVNAEVICAVEADGPSFSL